MAEDGDRVVLLSHQFIILIEVKLFSNCRGKDLLWIGMMRGLLTHILATEPLKQH